MINDRVEILIIKNLFFNEPYTREVLPFIMPEYFSDEAERTLVTKIKTFITNFNHLPTREAIIIQVSNDTKLSQPTEDKIREIVSNLNNDEKSDPKFLIEESQKFCQQKALVNAVYSTVDILEDPKKEKGIIPKLLSDALAVSFDPSVGHSYLDDADARFETYHKTEEKFPFDLSYFNKITRGGVPRKTLNVILAGTAVGKSLAMCHMAGSYLMSGKDVLYITLEMAQERIAERIDANLLNVSMQDLASLPKDLYDKKIAAIKSKTVGRFFIKEYPTATASATNFRALLNELALKKSFRPDVIFVDYLNIATSSRLGNNQTVNSYTYVKSIAEELRGMAVEFNVPIWTATQTNRCLTLDSSIITKKGTLPLGDIKVGDSVLSDVGWNNVLRVYPIEKQKTYLIKTKSGKTIKCSARHLFPSSGGLLSIDSGLKIGDGLQNRDDKKSNEKWNVF